MGFVSRSYIREKWNSLKWDMEKYLDILNEEAPDKIEEKDIEKVLPNINDKFDSIINELKNYRV